MGSTLPGLIFVGISVSFKLHNVINGSEEGGQRIPQGQQEIAVVVSSAGSLDLKAFTLQTKRNSSLKNVISGFSSSQWHPTLAVGAAGHWQTRQSCPKSSVCFAKDSLLETPLLWTRSPHTDQTYSSASCLKLSTLANQTEWIQSQRGSISESSCKSFVFSICFTRVQFICTHILSAVIMLGPLMLPRTVVSNLFYLMYPNSSVSCLFVTFSYFGCSSITLTLQFLFNFLLVLANHAAMCLLIAN